MSFQNWYKGKGERGSDGDGHYAQYEVEIYITASHFVRVTKHVKTLKQRPSYTNNIGIVS